MPNTSEGFDQVEASASPEHAVNVVKFESVQSDPAPRRRRGGRRVVRGVGAAGASLELKVEEQGFGSAVRGAEVARLRNLRMIPVIPPIPRV